MMQFYQGHAVCSVMNLTLYIQANSSMEAENKLLARYDEQPHIHGELISIQIESITASEYYGTKKYGKNIHI